MSNDEKANPLDDVKKGLGLLFRAAKTAAKSLPTDPIEKIVVDGAREVGRAVENVASSIEKEMFGDRKKKESATPSEGPPAEAKADAPPAPPPPEPIVTPPASASTPTSNGDAKPSDAADAPPKGPRVA